MESLKHLEAGSRWRAREQFFVGGAIFAEAWIVAEKMLLLELFSHSLSCKAHQLDLCRVAALEQRVTSHTKPQPGDFCLWLGPSLALCSLSQIMRHFGSFSGSADDVYLCLSGLNDAARCWVLFSKAFDHLESRNS